MRLRPFVRRSRYDTLQARFERMEKDRNRYRIWHWNRCGCHDSWDQCPCESDGHPADGSCNCCDLDPGCGPKPKQKAARAEGRTDG